MSYYPTRTIDIDVHLEGTIEDPRFADDEKGSYTETFGKSDPASTADYVCREIDRSLKYSDLSDVPEFDRLVIETEDSMYAREGGIVKAIKIEEDIDFDNLKKEILWAADANAGVECAECGETIGYRQGCSSPNGSMHKSCAQEHERENPAIW